MLIRIPSSKVAQFTVHSLSLYKGSTYELSLGFFKLQHLLRAVTPHKVLKSMELFAAKGIPSFR